MCSSTLAAGSRFFVWVALGAGASAGCSSDAAQGQLGSLGAAGGAAGAANGGGSGSAGKAGSAGANANGAGGGGASAAGSAGSSSAGTSAGGTNAGGTGGSAAGGSAVGGSASGAEGRTCALGNYLICEDFEGTAPGETPEGWSKHGDASGVAEDEARHGARALKLGAIPIWERRIYHDASVLGSQHWGRIFYKVQLPVPDAFVHATLVGFSGVGPTIGAAEFRVVGVIKQNKNTPDVGSRHNFLYNVQIEGSGEFGTETGYDWLFDDAWHCAEWHVDSSNQSYAFYRDGNLELEFERGANNYDDSELPDSFGELRVGWIDYQESSGFTAWVDDIALDEQRIGCD